MRTVESTVYTFDELSDRAKDRARDWYREGQAGDNYWSESVIEDAAHMADLLGIDLRQRPVKLMGGGTRYEPVIYWSGFSSQGDGACFQSSYSYRKGSVKAIATEAPEGTGESYKGNNRLNVIARELQAVQRRNFYGLRASTTTGRDNSMSIEVESDRQVSDEDMETVRECLQDFASYIYRQLEGEYEYQNADAQVDESIRANEYEFTEDGDRV